MSEFPSLEVVDRSGAIREAAEAAGVDRRDFLRKGAVAGGGIVAGSAFFGILTSAEAAISTKKKSKRNDVKILQFAMTLELLEANFYRQARDNKVFGDDAPLERFTRTVSAHEDDHVTFLSNALGNKRVSGLQFDFGDTVTNRDKFKATAQVLEDTGVKAYLGQAGNIKQTPVLEAAGSIVTVEARHASWIRFINGGGAPTADTASLPAPRTFDDADTERQILRAVGATGFIQS